MEDIINVNYSEIELNKEIGEGSFGIVYKAIWQTKLEVGPIAVKVIRNIANDSETKKKKFENDVLREIQTLQNCIHPNIITLHGVSKNPQESICLLLEFADCGSLHNYLHYTDKDVSFDQNLDWMLQCAKGMEYLHSKKTVHRDLKPQNLLLFNDCRTLKICDFGTVKELVTMNTENIGTICYMAPEICKPEGKYEEKCDVFSFGVTLWEVMSRKKPIEDFPGMNQFAIQNKFINGSRPEIKHMMIYEDSDCIKPIILKCWDPVPENRPTMQEICDLLPMYPLAYSNVDRQEIKPGSFIGRGRYGFIQRGFWETKGQCREIAVKVIRGYKEENAISFLKELRKVQQINHENIVTLYGVSKYNDNIELFFEYSDCGSLYNYLHYKNEKVSYNEKYDWLQQCVKGIEYLHSNKMIHGDLKTQKLLLFDEYRTLKICKSGVTKEFAYLNVRQTPAAHYTAPEVYVQGKYTEKCDVFCFGIIFWELMARKKPFDEFADAEQLDLQNQIINGDRPDINYLKDYKDSDRIQYIIEKCWDEDPCSRPTMTELSDLLPVYPPVSIKVNYNDIQLGALIGNGSYGIVFKATFYTAYQDREIAVKMIQNTQKERVIIKEIHDLKELNHANIVTLFGYSIDLKNRILMLLEYADCGSLYHVLHQTDKELFFIGKLNWLQQCAEGMKYLHSNKTIHRELKSQNILLFNRFLTLKICDFGRVKEFATINAESKSIDCFWAPEVWANEEYTEKSDVFSFGIICWEVMSRKKPFDNLKDLQPTAIKQKMIDGDCPNINDLMKHKSIDLIKPIIEKCWNRDPENRPTMKEICDLLDFYPFVNFDDIQLGQRIEFSDSVSYKAIWKIDGQAKDITAKIIIGKTSTLEKFTRNSELSALQKIHDIKQLNHPNIGSMYGLSKDADSNIYSVFENSAYGSVQNFLHRTDIEVSYDKKLNWMLQCAKGLEYLQSKQIVLWFIKPQRLMLFEDYCILKICDFGSNKDNARLTKAESVNFPYMAPEMHNAQEKCDSKKTEVFSFAIIFWEVLSRKVPFHDYLDEPSKIPKMMIDGIRPNLNDIKTNNDDYLIKPIIEKCWDPNADNRPTLTEITSYLSKLIA